MKKFRENFRKHFVGDTWCEHLSALIFLASLPIMLSVFLKIGRANSEIKKGDTEYSHIYIGTKPIEKIYIGNTLIWENTDSPTITNFSASPSSIDLDTRATGTISFTLAVTGTAGQTTTAQIYRLPENAKVGPSYSGANGANISQSLPNIPQPQKTTTYRLLARNGGGSSHSETTVTVTKNPTLANCRRISFSQQGFQYDFGFTLTGLPRPVVTYSFSGGITGTIANNLLIQGANPYTWSVNNFRVNMPSAANQSLTIMATNASGSVTCSLVNINN